MNKSIKSLQSLEFRPFIAAFRTESTAFWFLCAYIFVEYIRPQQMYTFLDILPWGQLTILVCVVSTFLTGSRAIGFGAMDKMFIAFSIWVVISGIFAWDPGESWSQWTTYTSWVFMYFCVVSILTTPNRVLLFTLFFVLINFKLSQHGARTFAMRGFSFTGWGLSGSPGWFHNSGELALQMVIVFSMSWSLLAGLREFISGTKRWWILLLLFPGTAALTIIGSSSRGGQIALLAVILIVLMKGRHLFKSTLIVAMLMFIGWSVLPEEQIARFNTLGEDETSEYRLVYWEDAIEIANKHPWTGIGYRNWGAYYQTYYYSISGRAEVIHNTFLEAFVDLGYPGGILFLIMVTASFVMNARSRREMNDIGGVEGKSIAAIATGINLGMLGTCIAAFFMSVLFYPMFWLAFALTSAVRHISRNKVQQVKNLPASLEEEPNTGSSISQ
jgi:putative inorganic carbon (HCO3(-)) transporter